MTVPEVFAVYKPKGPTSHDVINVLRKKLGTKKIGHAGTLDPLATGVLVVGIGSGTKKLSEIVQKEKEYVATIKLGEYSTTDDEEGSKTTVLPKSLPTAEAVKKVLASFVGETEQVPPIFSAIKQNGVTAYKQARRGQVPVMAARKVRIDSIELVSFTWPQLVIRVQTGPGVYIRALARDIGTKLGTAGYLQELQRTRVGQFSLQSTIQVSAL